MLRCKISLISLSLSLSLLHTHSHTRALEITVLEAPSINEDLADLLSTPRSLHLYSLYQEEL